MAEGPHYNSFYTQIFIPEQANPTAMKRKIDEWKKSLAQTLAEYMIEKGAVDLSMTYTVCEKTGKPGYNAMAQTLLTNPKIAIDNDVFVHERLRIFAEQTEWESDELKEAFFALLEKTKPRNVAVH